MKISDMFRDDYTKQLSLSRVSVAIVLCLLLSYAGYQLYVSGVFPDLPDGWLAYLLGQYGVNKASSTINEIKANANIPND